MHICRYFFLFSGISVCQYYLHPKKCPYFPIELQSSLGIIRPWAGPTWWPPIAMSPPLYQCLITAIMESYIRVSPQAIGLWYDLVKFNIFSRPNPSGFYRGQKETNSNSQMTCSLRKSRFMETIPGFKFGVILADMHECLSICNCNGMLAHASRASESRDCLDDHQ